MLKLLVSVCVMLSAAMQTAQSKPDSKSSRQLYEQAAKAIAAADSRAAISPLEKLIEDQPTSSLACIAAVHLAECYVSVERASDAAELLEKWSERISNTSKSTKLDANLDAHHFRVWLQAAKRISDNAAAIKSLESLSEKFESHASADKDPGISETHCGCQIELARRLAATGKFEQASSQLNKLIQAINEPSSELQLLQAIVFQQLSNHALARKTLQTLLESEPQTKGHTLARLELATYALQDRDIKAATELLGPIIDSEQTARGLDKTQDCRFRLLWSEIELSRGNAVHSLEVLPGEEQLVEFDEPQQIAVRFSRAEAATRAGKHALALAELKWLSEHSQKAASEPNWAMTVALRQCELLLKMKDYAKLSSAVADAKKRFANFERLHEFDYLLARAAMLQIDFEQARTHLHSIIESPSANNTAAAVRAQWMLGETFFMEQNPSAAIEAYKPVTLRTESQPWQALALIQTAKCHELLNQSSDALDTYQRVVASTKDETLRQEAAARIEVIERTATRVKPTNLR